MATRTVVLALSVALAVSAFELNSDVSPVQKVVTMLEDLQTQVIMEGKTEAKSYDKFACFCKDMSEEKTWDIEDAQDLIADLTATINQKTADREDYDQVIAEQSQILEEKEKTMEESAALRKKNYDAFMLELNDCYTATKEIDFAVVELKAREKEVHSSLVSLKGMTKTVRKMALLAEALGLESKHRKAVDALLQQDPEVPMEDFTFDATEVIKEVKELKPGFEGRIKELKLAESKSVFEHTSVMQALTDEKKAAEKTLAEAEKMKAEAMKTIADSQQQLTTTSAQMTDDQAYLKDLMELCNTKSKEWDQRSKMRQDELTALTSALSIMKERVAAKTTEKTVRFMQGETAVSKAAVVADDSSAAKDTKSADAVTADASEGDADSDTDAQELADGVEAEAAAPSFVQLSSPRRAIASAIQLRGAPADKADGRTRVLTLLRKRSEELDSPVLAALASKVAADPFVKIRKLIQELIERLLQEAADEANHKGWCDKAFGKAKQSRATKAEMVTKLNTALSENEAKRDGLAEQIAKLTKELDELNNSLSTTTKMRNDESAENAATVSEAQEGLEAVEEAIDILDKFYKTSAKAEIEFLQTHANTKGVADDLPDTGFGGAYKASQGASTGVLGMMDVIKSDFERTIKETEKDEKHAAAEFLAFDTETKSSISQKTTAKNAMDSEKVETEGSIAEDKESLTQEQSLLDKSIQEIQELQPACVDTGMSYEERVAKREQEIESLKEALCTLDKEGPEQTEPECA